MSLTVLCRCDKKFLAEDRLAGKAVVCPACGDVLVVPKVQSTPRERQVLPTLNAKAIESSAHALPSYNAPPPTSSGGYVSPQQASSVGEESDRFLVVKVALIAGAVLLFFLTFLCVIQLGPLLMNRSNPAPVAGEPSASPAAGAPSSTVPGAGSTRFQSSSGAFSVSFPGVAQSQSGSTQVIGGQASFEGARYNGDQGVIFQAIAYQLPPTPSLEEQEELLNAYCDRVSRSKRVTKRIDLVLGARVGRELEYSDTIEGRSMIVRTQIYQLDTRQIHLMVMRPNTATADTAAKAFFDSLRIQ